MASATVSGAVERRNSPFNRELTRYPERAQRRWLLLLVVAITIVLYYALYVGGGVATLMLPQLKIPFTIFVYLIAAGNLLGAFASLLAGLTDRFGRANLVVYGLLIVGAITLFWIPNVTTALQWGIAYWCVAFVEGIILVATPALIRDFSPQVGRATAMGFWTVGPVLGSLAVSAINTATLPVYNTWQSQYYICGIVTLVIFVLAFLFLRELAPALRDQLMVTERDRVLVELKARGLNIEASLRHPWRQMMHADVIISALGVSVLLLFYYTAVGFGVIYLVSLFGFSVNEANELGNWAWASNAVALVVAGVVSDRFRVRKPFMLGGAIGALVLTAIYIAEVGQTPSFTFLAVISSVQSIFVGFAYVTWMASFTETVEARNPALTATGLAVWGWLLRLVVTASLIALPLVVSSMNTLVNAAPYMAAFNRAKMSGVAPSPALVAHMQAIGAAAAAAPGQWRVWFGVCNFGVLVFLATIFVMRGRWSPARARDDEAAHNALVANELAALNRQPAE